MTAAIDATSSGDGDALMVACEIVALMGGFGGDLTAAAAAANQPQPW